MNLAHSRTSVEFYILAINNRKIKFKNNAIYITIKKSHIQEKIGDIKDFQMKTNLKGIINISVKAINFLEGKMRIFS